ncbi:MAG TPA: hypothetical protein VFM54_08605 [Micromonosporaceae bacterium]|nr:hypothetical protein [Micromonosporaceae bacterium]
MIAAAERYLAEHAPRLAPTYVELGRKGTVAAAWSGATGARTVRVGAGDLADHACDLCRPALLIVEDQDSDGCFIRSLARVLRADQVLRALVQGWLEIQHGGGGSLTKVAKSAVGRYRRQVRVAVLLDSDRLVPGQHTRSHMKADELRTLGVLVHVLELREAENYVPNRVLRAIGRPHEASRKLGLVKRLTPQQRGHFDMKTGFGPPGGPPVVPSEQAALFGDLEEDVRLGLRGGFGKDLLRRMEDAGGHLTEQDVAGLGADVLVELRALLVTIASVI